jgi:hypothetical protein
VTEALTVSVNVCGLDKHAETNINGDDKHYHSFPRLASTSIINIYDADFVDFTAQATTRTLIGLTHPTDLSVYPCLSPTTSHGLARVTRSPDRIAEKEAVPTSCTDKQTWDPGWK